MLEIILAILTKGFAFCTLYMDFGQEVEQRSADSDAPAIDLSTINLTAKTFVDLLTAMLQLILAIAIHYQSTHLIHFLFLSLCLHTMNGKSIIVKP